MSRGVAPKTLVATGALGVSQVVATDIVAIVPGPGRFQVTAQVRHTLADGVRLAVGPVGAPTIIATYPQAANVGIVTVPIVLEILNKTDSIILELAVATGGADSASAILCVDRLVEQ
jgi:hypothetical protein